MLCGVFVAASIATHISSSHTYLDGNRLCDVEQLQHKQGALYADIRHHIQGITGHQNTPAKAVAM
jgi:hypothetical protein